MTTTQRTDIHRPSAPEFDPEAYELRGVFDLHHESPDKAWRFELVNRLVDEGYRFGSHGSGQSGHCGAYIRYAALMARGDVREMIYVGEQCLDNRFSGTKADFDALRKAAAARGEASAKALRIAGLVDSHPLLAWLTYNVADWDEGSSFGFVLDLSYKFRRYGELSDRQIEAVEQAIIRDTERNDARLAREAAKAELAASGVQAPEGKVTVVGEIVSVRAQDGDWGTTWKMTVRADAGWLVWSTIPAAIFPNQISGGAPEVQELVGRRVQFVATLTRSDKDVLFAFAKRPTGARLLEVAS